RLTLRTFVTAAPVAADLFVDQVVGGQFRPFGVGEFLLHFFQEAVIHIGTQRGIGLARRRTRHGVSALDLPANVGGAIQGVTRERRLWKEFRHPRVETHCVLRRSPASAPLLRLAFRIYRLTEQDAIGLGGLQMHYTAVFHPAADIAPLRHLLVK